MGKSQDLLDKTFDPGHDTVLDPMAELDAVTEDLEALLKNGEVIAALTARGINASIAMLAASGLRSYLKGNKGEAADDLATAAEEIGGRIAGHRGGGPQAFGEKA